MRFIGLSFFLLTLFFYSSPVHAQIITSTPAASITQPYQQNSTSLGLEQRVSRLEQNSKETNNLNSKNTFELINDLISAVAQWLWPIFAFVVLFIFKNQIIKMLPRIKKGKLPGVEFELEKQVDELSEQVKESQQRSAPVIKANVKDEQTILETTAKNPKIGFLMLAEEIEKEIRNLFATSGLLEGKNYIGSKQALDLIVQRGYVNKNTLSSLEIFDRVKDIIVNGRNVEEKEIVRAVDIGMTLLRTLKATPHEINIVYEPDVNIFSDPNCKNLITDAKGLILETTSPGGAEKSFRIFPVTKFGYYKKGKQITWEWVFSSKVWNDTWYEDPKTKKPKLAWNSSAEFAGRHLDEV